jgi:hypothetical protein
VLLLVLVVSGCGGAAAPAPAPVTHSKVEPAPPSTPVVVAPAPPKPCASADECSRRCDKDDAPSCTEIGRRFLAGDGVDADKALAKQAFDRACAKRQPHACYQLVAGWDDDASLAHLGIACDGDVGDGCAELALRYVEGTGVAADPAKGRALAEKACKLTSQIGCNRLGLYLMDGIGGDKDLPRAAELSRHACDADLGTACARLGEMYDGGLGVAKDQVTARKLYQRACDLGSHCNNLGVMYARGEGGAKDLPKSMAAYEKECDDTDEGMGCVNRARQWRDGAGGKRNLGEASRLFFRGCKRGVQAGCDELQPVVEQLEQDCKKSAADCNNWGFAQRFGYGVEQSIAGAMKAYEKACGAKDANACENLGWIYTENKVHEPDPKKAFDYFTKACKLNDDDACKALKDHPAK